MQVLGGEVKIHIRTTTKPFGPHRNSVRFRHELAYVIEGVSAKVQRDGQPKRGEVWMLKDSNGQKCGTVRA